MHKKPNAASAEITQEQTKESRLPVLREPIADPARIERIRASQRRHQMPHVATAVTAAAGTSAWGIAEATQVLAGPVWAVPLTAAAAMGATVTVIRWVNHRAIDKQWRRRFWVAGTVSTLWVTVSSVTGVGWVMAGSLLVAEVSLSWKWWRANRPSLPAAPEVKELRAAPYLEPDALEDLGRYPKLWAENVGSDDGKLPKSKLTGGYVTEYGSVSYTVQLNPGKQVLRNALAAIEAVASGLLVGEENILFDQLPAVEGEVRNSSQIRIQIIKRLPVATSPWFVAPAIDPSRPGVIGLGPFADGQGMAEWVLFDHRGMWSGVVIGGTGSGKSGLVNVLAASARATGVLNVMYIDPQGGASSPDLVNNASILALGEAAAIDALEALERDAFNREVFMNAHGLSKIIPGKPVPCDDPDCGCEGKGLPGLLVILEECDQVFGGVDRNGKPTVKRWGKLAKRIRKLAEAFACVSQHSGLEVFGGSDFLRSNLAAENYVALKTKSKSSGGLIPGLPVNPSTLPEGKPGFGYVGGGTQRTAPFRASFLPSSDDELPVEPPMWAKDAFAAYPEPELHPVDREAIAGLFDAPDVAAQQARTEAQATLARIMSGQPVERPSVAAEERTGIQVGDVPEVPAGLTVADLRLIKGEGRGPSAKSRVLDYVRAATRERGKAETGEIAEALGLALSTVSQSLRVLADARDVRKNVHGEYSAVDDAEGVA